MTDVQKATTAHDLTAQAVECRNAEQAAVLLEEATRILKEIRDPAAAKLAVYRYDGREVELGHILKPSKVVKAQKETVLTERLKVVEHSERKMYRCFALADNGKGFVVAIPHEKEEPGGQDLLLDGKSVFVDGPPRRKEFHASPDSRRVAMSHRLLSEPIEILDVATGKVVSVPEPKELAEQQHYNVYALTFHKWADDAQSFFATVEGFTTSPGKMMDYRETWRIDATTGQAARVKRVEQRYAEKHTWDDEVPATGPSK